MTDVDGERALVGIMSELVKRLEAVNSAVRSFDMECIWLRAVRNLVRPQAGPNRNIAPPTHRKQRCGGHSVSIVPTRCGAPTNIQCNVLIRG